MIGRVVYCGISIQHHTWGPSKFGQSQSCRRSFGHVSCMLGVLEARYNVLAAFAIYTGMKFVSTFISLHDYYAIFMANSIV
ncbi:hypothetical protein JK2ML_0939 [Mycobacterium leprae Kyoto-2]|uniref:Uncharacterized protein n=3 Tax=Mycobacterium leprae TaxID=1769 RepID=Q9CCD3_MYCLE|nr:hypothetical protein DIJ64_05045 [Mycobacterium leprae]OAR20728.1 hypothetical protein A8144_09605 [Mycobacterium leprae 3125609]OAX70879.1 hypothetical protein A3216_09170 [Mycobacterium leprae 7935681]CAR71034.1 hypothetical protein MLBr00939 [Mycobacterium leprae Br4923]BBC16875.1 hypothetical protein JK2ML_0939 [Mycobacterium leprae Kyoto-2]